MKLTTRKAGALGLGLALVVGVGGIAAATTFDANDWYSGGNATVGDPDRTSVPLTIYNSGGTAITSGSTTAPIGAFIAADSAVRDGDNYASVFLVRPDAGSAPGAWTGVQATGTTKSDATHPAALNGKPFVATTGGYSIADFAAGYPVTASTGTFKDVYELRLRSSSAQNGLSDKYASTFVKVTGTTWAVTTAPTTGGPTTTPTTPAPTTPAPTAPATPAVVKVAASKPTIKISKKPTAKKAGKATVTVKPASGRAQPTGKITISIKGKTTKKISVTLSGGKKSVTLPKLKKGSYKLTVSYGGDANYLPSTAKAISLKVKK